jgi:hypothetical protein
MLKPFKSVSLCFVATLVLVQVHAEKPRAMGQASPQVETTPAAAEKIRKGAKDRVPQQSDEAEQAAKLARMRATKGGMSQESDAKQAKLDRMRASGGPQQSEAATDKMKMQSKAGGVATNSGALTGQSGKTNAQQTLQMQQVQQQSQKQNQMQQMMQSGSMQGQMKSK